MKCVRCTLDTTPLYGDLVYLLMNILGHQNKEACDSLNNVLNTQVAWFQFIFHLLNGNKRPYIWGVYRLADLLGSAGP